MNSPKVSIIINNYNYARYLRAAVNSALSQTYKTCEVIVVDDGSKDDSRTILEEFEGRVSVVLRENGGQAAAFNSGFAISSGQLIAFLDSDDELFPHSIETSVKHWNDDFAKLQYPLEILDVSGAPTGLHMPRLPVAEGDIISSFLKTGRYVASPTSGNVFSRRFLEQVMPIPEAEWAKTADGYLNHSAPFYGRIGAIQTPLAYYRVHGQSMSSVISKGKLNLKTAQQLMLNGLREKELIEHIAAARNLKADPGVVVSHWLFLKLKLTLEKTSAQEAGRSFLTLDVLRTGSQMIKSILRSPELSLAKKLQHAAWTLGVVFSPGTLAQKVIKFAFETAPQPGLPNALRRW